MNSSMFVVSNTTNVVKDSLQKGAKANSVQERKKRKSIKDRERTQGGKEEAKNVVDGK